MKKRFVAFIFALVCCVSVFGVFSMTNREPVAFADSVSTLSTNFDGSNFDFAISIGASNSASEDLSSSKFAFFNKVIVPSQLSFHFSKNNSNDNFVVTLYGSLLNLAFNNQLPSFISQYNYPFSQLASTSFTLSDFGTGSGGSTINIFSYSPINYTSATSQSILSDYDYLYFGFACYVFKPASATSLPNFEDLSSYCLGNSDDGVYSNRFGNMGSKFNYLRYEFSSEWSITLAIPCDNQYLLTSFRRYYFNPSTELSDNEFYQQGVASGSEIGYASGQQAGYSSGYADGRVVGYANGYNEGLSQTDYSFFDLFGSVIDAPVHVLTGLFNFELLGVNLWTLFTGLFTLAFVLWILKLVLGGK